MAAMGKSMVSQGKIRHFSAVFQEMDSAQKALEAKAAQLRGLRGAASLGNGELERLVDQMTEELESQARGSQAIWFHYNYL
jgi:hypothetical protein